MPSTAAFVRSVWLENRVAVIAAGRDDAAIDDRHVVKFATDDRVRSAIELPTEDVVLNRVTSDTMGSSRLLK